MRYTDYDHFPEWNLPALTEFLLSCLTSKLKNKNIVWQTTLKRLLILDFQLVLYNQNREVKKCHHFQVSLPLNGTWNKTGNRRHGYYTKL